MYDFYSDTKTKPTNQMRQAVLECDVGDEQKGEDPTTSGLCVRVAELLGKEAAVFLPSGTMCNEIAINVSTNLEAEQAAKAIRPASRYAPRSAMLCVEQTANMGGGAVWPTVDECGGQKWPVSRCSCQRLRLGVDRFHQRTRGAGWSSAGHAWADTLDSLTIIRTGMCALSEWC